MITPTIKIKKEARNAARSDRGAAKSTVKRALRTPKKESVTSGAISAYGTARSTIKGSAAQSQRVGQDRRLLAGGDYLSVGQIYLYDNPLLKKPLKKEHVKPRLLGHWGTTPG